MDRKEEKFRQFLAANKVRIMRVAGYCAPSDLRLKSEALNRTADGGEFAEGRSRTRSVRTVRPQIFGLQTFQLQIEELSSEPNRLLAASSPKANPALEVSGPSDFQILSFRHTSPVNYLCSPINSFSKYLESL